MANVGNPGCNPEGWVSNKLGVVYHNSIHVVSNNLIKFEK